MDTRVGCYGWIEQDGRVLLVHWSGDVDGNGAGWTLPGGGMEVGETPEQTARREVTEETGYVVELGEVMGVDSIYISPQDRLLPGDRVLHGLRVVYRARIVDGTLRVEQDGPPTTRAGSTGTSSRRWGASTWSASRAASPGGPDGFEPGGPAGYAPPSPSASMGTAVPLTLTRGLPGSTRTWIRLGRPMSAPWWMVIVVSSSTSPSSRR